MTRVIDSGLGRTQGPWGASRRLEAVITLAFTMCLLVTSGLVAHAAGSRPPLPPNGKEVSPGQVPRTCAPGEAASQGYYFSDRAHQWVAAPFCYGRWGNLYASGSQIVAAGASVTVTATPSEGSNSGTYAPQTGSITWQYPGKIVSGCGPKSLSCTVIPTTGATAEWQWFQFHVSMPRTFFIDSPGDLCGGQHLCAGATTNAWSYVGIAPAGAASATTAPGGGNGLSMSLFLFVLAALAVAFVVARSGTAGRPVKQSMAGSSELKRIQEANDGWSASHPDPLQVDPTAGGPTKAGQLQFQKDLQEYNRQLGQHMADLRKAADAAADGLREGTNTKDLSQVLKGNDAWIKSHPDPFQVDPTAGGSSKAGQLKFQKELQAYTRQLEQHLAELQSVGNTAAAPLGSGGSTPVQPNPTSFGGPPPPKP